MSSRPGIEGLDPPSPAEQEITEIAARPETRAALKWLRTAEPQFAQWQMEMAAIPSPPFGEAARGEWLKRRFQELGLVEIHADEVGNIFGLRAGTTSKDYVSISAHIDTVFPDGTPLSVRQEGKRLFGPGISDNGAGATAMLAVAGSLRAANLSHSLPILFIGNVGEEGEGDLRGMRHIFTQSAYRDRIRYSVVLDGAGCDSIVTEALGSLRFEVVLRGPGGHSWTDFGLPNPVLALARAINYFSETPLPASPKTTFNVGVIRGGNSVNSIPESASMRVDIRSSSMAAMERLERALRDAVARAMSDEPEHNAALGGDARLASEIIAMGQRPAGELPPDARILQVIRAVDSHLGNVSRVQRASTDANIPLSLGREAIGLGGGGKGGGAHTLQEWFDCSGRELGLRRILLTVLALAARP